MEILREIKTFFVIVSLLCFSAISLAEADLSIKRESAPPTSTPAAEDFNLGVLLGFTGAGAVYSKDGLKAIQLAVDEINNEGGFLGKHKIKIIHKNTQTKANVAAREAIGLIHRDNVKAILGTYSSSSAIAIKPIAEKNKVIHIAAISNSETITIDKFSPYTFSVVPNSFMQAKSVAIAVSKMAKENKWKKYVTLASDYEWGHTTQKNFVSQLQQINPEIELVKEIWPRLGDPSFSDHITEIVETNPDFVFGVIASKDNVRWLHLANSINLFDKYPYPGSLISVSELMLQKDTLPRGITGLARAPFFAHKDSPMMKKFVNNYRKKYNKYPTDWAVLEYDAVYALKQGIEKAQSIDPDKIKNALSGLKIDTTRGAFSFRKIDHQLNCPSYFGVIQDSPEYPFPILKELVIVSGKDSMRTEEEIINIRNKTNK